MQCNDHAHRKRADLNFRCICSIENTNIYGRVNVQHAHVVAGGDNIVIAYEQPLLL